MASILPCPLPEQALLRRYCDGGGYTDCYTTTVAGHVRQADYVEAAEARGIGRTKVTWRHAFRNALVPVITVIGLQFALLLGGAVLTESTFNWPGLGQKLVDYINERDYGAVQGIITIFAVAVVLISLLVDIVNAIIDPRVRY